MKKRKPSIARKSTRKPKKATTKRPSRELIHSILGKYKGSGLMEELMEEKKRERGL
jgi:hypothetical protein